VTRPSTITVCICTYKRPELLAQLLPELERLQTDGAFTLSVVVADNDRLRSAEVVVRQFEAKSTIPVEYRVEPQQNIALARNRAVAGARGDWLAFIDDDELPARDWLLQLLRTAQNSGADAVLGPVMPRFQQEPPRWVRRGGLFDRPSHPTGMTLSWEQARTGNVLLRREALEGLGTPFRVEFGSGSEDQDFFRRLSEQGRRFVWCQEAVAYETVPPVRWQRGFMLRKALLRGKNSLKYKAGRGRDVVKALVAVPLYTIALPFLLIAGQHWFMKYLIKLCDHVGRLLAWLGFNPGGDVYVTE